MKKFEKELEKFYEENGFEFSVLEAEYDSHNSFYDAAYVLENNEYRFLISYGVAVAVMSRMDNYSKPILFEDWDYSRTTIRHIKEFFKQFNYRADSAGQIRKDYLYKESPKEIKVLLNDAPYFGGIQFFN